MNPTRALFTLALAAVPLGGCATTASSDVAAAPQPAASVAPAKAKNVIVFIGDGMGISTITAARTRDALLPNVREPAVIDNATGYNKWACNTCAYEFPITKQMTARTHLARKAVDDELGGKD